MQVQKEWVVVHILKCKGTSLIVSAIKIKDIIKIHYTCVQLSKQITKCFLSPVLNNSLARYNKAFAKHKEAILFDWILVINLVINS